MAAKKSVTAPSRLVARVLGAISPDTNPEARLDALSLAPDEVAVLAAFFASGWSTTFEGLTVEHGHVTALTITPTGHRSSTPPLAGPLKQLASLRRLEVAGYLGKRADVEPGFFDMPSLHTLEIRSLTKGTIPPELATLVNLRELAIHSCKLETLVVGSLPPALTKLSLEFNNFTAVPEAVFDVATLVHLSLDDNKIARDDGAWDQLTALTTLNLASNKLKAIPHLLASQTIRRLTRLDLCRNPVVVSEATRASLPDLEVVGAHAPEP